MTIRRISLRMFLAALMLSGMAGSVQGQRAKAYEEIQTMKERGLVLVMLPSRKLLIDRLKKEGYPLRAKYYAKEQDSLNSVSVAAFRGYFKFCDVAYFSAEDIESILIGDFDDKLFDANGELIESNIDISDRAVYLCHPEKIWVSSVEQGSLFAGLSLTYSNQKALPSPFPYYVRKHEGLFFLRRTSDEMVERLNSKLDKFYKKAVIATN